MNKKLTSLSVSACLALSVLAGCSTPTTQGNQAQNTPKNESGSNSASEQKVTINFAGISTFGEDSWKQLISEFEQQNPNIKVNLTQLPSASKSTEIHQYLVTALSQKNDIDVFTGDIIWVPEFAAAGWTEPMDSYLKDKDQYYPGVINAVTYNGKIMAVPWYVDGGMLYYRKDLLEKYNKPVPKTWDELTSTAKEIVEKEKNSKLNGFIWQAKQAEVLVCDFMEFLASANGAVLDKDEKPVIDSPATRKALEAMKGFITSGVSPQSVLSFDEEPSRTVFTDGNAVFLRNWSYVWNNAQDEKISKVVGKVGVAPLPAFEGGKSASTMGGYQYMVAKNSKNKEAAIKFAQFLSAEKAQLYFAQKVGFSPTRPAVLNNEELKKSNPFLVEIGKVFDGTAARPISPKYPQISLQLQSNISAMLSGKLTADQAVTEMNKQIKSILSK